LYLPPKNVILLSAKKDRLKKPVIICQNKACIIRKDNVDSSPSQQNDDSRIAVNNVPKKHCPEQLLFSAKIPFTYRLSTSGVCQNATDDFCTSIAVLFIISFLLYIVKYF
jgi:hypothetical protein